MRTITPLILIMILSILILSSCATSQPICNAPYYEYKAGDCCLDTNQNQICDIDERTTMNVEEQMTIVAEKFARKWEQKDFGAMYDLFTPDLQQQKSRQDFIDVLNFKESKTSVVVRLDRVSKESDTVGYAYYSVSSSIYDSKAPAMNLIEISPGEWRVNGLKKYFLLDNLQLIYPDQASKSMKLATEFLETMVELLSEHEKKNANRKIGIFNFDTCPKFEEHRNDLVKFKEEFNNLEVATGFEGIHIALYEAYGLIENSMEEFIKFCYGKDSYPMWQHYEKGGKYLEAAGKSFLKIAEDLKSNDKYFSE